MVDSQSWQIVVNLDQQTQRYNGRYAMNNSISAIRTDLSYTPVNDSTVTAIGNTS